MGLMRFLLPPDRIMEETARQSYLSGFERIPWQVHAELDNNELVLERATSDSASLHIPWPVEGYGRLILSTGTLMERSEPYYLPLELARGEVGQVRNQLAEWRAIGLMGCEDVDEKAAEATRYFSKAVAAEQGSPESNQWAEQAIRTALEASHLLATAYTEQALAVRRRAVQRLDSFLGANLGVSPLEDYTAREVLQTFNAAGIPMSWREVETQEEHFFWDIVDKQLQWCQANRLSVVAGPLLQFDPRTIPDWLYLYEDDFDSLLDFASQFVRTVVNRYRGQVDLWVCAGRVNTAATFSMTEEEKVRLAARAVEQTRLLDPDTPVVVSFDQPWAEYLSRREMDFSPLHFADALVRANLGLTGLMLEINVGYDPGGTMPRDPIEFSRQMDYWSLLGVPLYLSISAPSGSHADPLASRQTKLPPGSWSPKAQQTWVSRYVPLLLAKPAVHGLLWNQLRDAEPHDFPHGGLFDLRRHPKPALRQLASIRTAHLK
jgi:hypothetical protein